MSWSYFVHNVPNGCSFTLPTSGTIAATSIWNEATDTFPTTNHPGVHGVMGVHGDIIIAVTGGNSVIYSDDLGGSWTTTGTLPASLAFPADSTKWLFPTSWQYVDGVWYCHLRENNSAANTTAYIGSTVDGSTWTVGDAVYNGRYSSVSAWVDPSTMELAFSGRRMDTNNHIIWSLYSSAYGSATVSGTYVDGPDNNNSIRLLRVGDNYFSGVWNGFNHDVYQIDTSFTGYTKHQATNWASVSGHQATNGIDTVLINDVATHVMQWQADITDGALPEITLTGLTYSQVSIGWNAHHWLFSGSASTTTWQMAHSESQDGTSVVRGPNVTLPDQQSSTGSVLPTIVNIYPSNDGWWVGFYIKASDGKLRIIKFQYGTYTGSCF